jgi:hypothetical protein
LPHFALRAMWGMFDKQVSYNFPSNCQWFDSGVDTGASWWHQCLSAAEESFLTGIVSVHSVAQVQWSYECVDDGAKARSCSTDWQVLCKYRCRTSWQLLLRNQECVPVVWPLTYIRACLHPCLLCGLSVLPAVAMPEYNLLPTELTVSF